MGEYHEDISGVDEAIAIFNRIPPERMNGIPSIGINIHTPGTEAYEDTQLDILSGRMIDLEMLDYVPEIKNNPEAVASLQNLLRKYRMRRYWVPFRNIIRLQRLRNLKKKT